MPKVKNTGKRLATKDLSSYGRRAYKKQVKGYINNRGELIGVGDVVRLSKTAMVAFLIIDDEQREKILPQQSASKVVSVFPDIQNLVLLEYKLGGYWTWDVNDLQKGRSVRVPLPKAVRDFMKGTS